MKKLLLLITCILFITIGYSQDLKDVRFSSDISSVGQKIDIEDYIRFTKGIKYVHVYLKEKMVHIKYEPGKTTIEEIKKNFNQINYNVEVIKNYEQPIIEQPITKITHKPLPITIFCKDTTPEGIRIRLLEYKTETAGLSLIKFQKEYMNGVTTSICGVSLSTLGSVIIYNSELFTLPSSLGYGIVIIGTLFSVYGTVMIIDSHKHIKSAGKILKISPTNIKLSF